jgi:hypothetical protein
VWQQRIISLKIGNLKLKSSYEKNIDKISNFCNGNVEVKDINETLACIFDVYWSVHLRDK